MLKSKTSTAESVRLVALGAFVVEKFEKYDIIFSNLTTFSFGHWNFFTRCYVHKKADSLVKTDYNPRWSFEWKNMGSMDVAEDPILYPDIFLLPAISRLLAISVDVLPGVQSTTQ